VSDDPRAAAAERLLAERGVRGATVSVEGDAGEIAALHLPDDATEALIGERGAEIAEAVRALGFRYVGIDLG
jgi:PP-loop superfamily ATP-utilizing enzyme